MSKRKSGKSTIDKDVVDAEIVTPETPDTQTPTIDTNAPETVSEDAVAATGSDPMGDPVVTPEPSEEKELSEDHTASEGADSIDAQADDTPKTASQESPESDPDAAQDTVSPEETTSAETGADADGTRDAADLSDDVDKPQTPANRDTTDEPAVTPAPQVIRETTIEKKAGFVPTLLGGVLAAAAGFGLAQVLGPDLLAGRSTEPDPVQVELQQRLDAVSGQIDTLSGTVAELAAAEVDLSPVTTQLDALAQGQSDLTQAQTSAAQTLDGMSAASAAMEAALTDLANRVATLEQRPIADTVPEEAIAAYERALDELRAEIATQRDTLGQEIEAQRQEVARMVADAAATEQAASAQAELAKARAALAEVMAALDTGTGFGGALSTLSETAPDAVPAALAGASAGIPTMTELAATFPALARQALSAARTTGEDAQGGLGNFLKAQLGVRSLEPQEGSDPDAVLSRAEAAVRGGDLDTALAEIATLPAPAQDILADWTAQAQTRQAALAAAAELGQALNAE